MATEPAPRARSISQRPDPGELLRRTAELAVDFLASLPERPVHGGVPLDELRGVLGRPLDEDGEDPVAVIEQLAEVGGRAAVAMAGPRYFGFVIGGSLPAALAADWLTSTWDQNAGLYVAGPAASVVEEAAGAWLIDLFGLPQQTGYGFVTGCQMAHFACLAAARHRMLERLGWDVEARGLFGAPEIEVVVGAEAHATLHAALQYLGMGRDRVRIVETDEQGRMRADRLAATLEGIPAEAAVIVCLQAGNVNSGSLDPLGAAIDLAGRRSSSWVHVDGAFGLWAAASPELRHLLEGVERADSWATDAHKWLNVPYDSGLAFVADPTALAGAMSPPHAPYLEYGDAQRDEVHWVPEYSRRARGFTVYAALRTLGRDGVRDLVERCCRIARRMAERLAAAPGVEVLNDVVLNQVLVRFSPADGGGDPDELTREVIRRVQEDGTAWLSGTTWHGVAAMRISVSNWSTTEEDADLTVDAILRAAGR